MIILLMDSESDLPADNASPKAANMAHSFGNDAHFKVLLMGF